VLLAVIRHWPGRGTAAIGPIQQRLADRIAERHWHSFWMSNAGELAEALS
jgi:hypothetical protein